MIEGLRDLLLLEESPLWEGKEWVRRAIFAYREMLNMNKPTQTGTSLPGFRTQRKYKLGRRFDCNAKYTTAFRVLLSMLLCCLFLSRSSSLAAPFLWTFPRERKMSMACTLCVSFLERIFQEYLKYKKSCCCRSTTILPCCLLSQSQRSVTN